jgi:hypothetical protein
MSVLIWDKTTMPEAAILPIAMTGKKLRCSTAVTVLELDSLACILPVLTGGPHNILWDSDG